ncbi:hypothetical protein F3Y22_tig00002058pilonHSYRG00012 [Hibiscus syriacus]|uniref:Reverse transcriptase domain-containing protein n=1 Tax=Hibiscus syriacus TaxID=106335 RepID=A0A6A3CZD2_HIBSY|nr:hypothetical protein F3Y22_tig00002058pilonHSYRG00012 [Hibiscus syriacus]
MKEVTPPAVKGEGKVERNHKRFRPTEEDRVSDEEVPRRSWRDTVISPSILPENTNISMEVEVEDLDEEEEGEGDDIPTIKIPQELKEKLRKPWKKALIIKILGKTVAYKTLVSRVTNLWKLEGHRVTDCLASQNEYPVVRETNRESQNQVQQERQEVRIKEIQQDEKEEGKDRYGPWMLVQRRQRGSKFNSKNQRSKNQEPSRNNRFANLEKHSDEDLDKGKEENNQSRERNNNSNVAGGVTKNMKSSQREDCNNRNKGSNLEGISSKVNDKTSNGKSQTPNSNGKKDDQGKTQVSKFGGEGNQIAELEQIIEKEKSTDKQGHNLMDIENAPNQLDSQNALEMEAEPVEQEQTDINCKELIRDENPSIICLLKTKAKTGVGSVLEKKLKFDTHFEVPAQGLRGGLILVWNTNQHDIIIRGHTDQIIHAEIQENGKRWLLSTVYVQSHSNKKDEFWENIRDCSMNINQPWMVVGDFNDFATIEERVGSNSDCMERILKFRECWNMCNLMDVGYIGSKFTWTRHIHGRVTLQERLDRLLQNADMVDLFPNLRVITLNRVYLDHNPILVNTDLGIPVDKEKRPFRFETAWLTHEDFKTVFSLVWDKKKDSLVNAVEETKKAIIEWKENRFGNIFKRKKTLMKRIKGVKSRGNSLVSESKAGLDVERFIPKLSEDDKTELSRNASMDEVREALFSMKGMKAPGPDGIQPIFYKQNWNTVKDTICDFVNTSLELGMMDVKILKTFLVLIPKKIVADNITQLIGPYQNNFLKGKSTTDNILVVQEVVHSMMNLKGRKGVVIAKIDLQKAYDNVSWEFLERTLQDFNFPDKLIKIIMFCIKSSTIEPLWNGEITEILNPKQGLRQGDPLSPYLFILVMERLSHMILEREEKGLWKSFKCLRGGVKLSHLFFTDDLLLFAEAKADQMNNIRSCLHEFSRAGVEVNLQKSKKFISPNVNSNMARDLSHLCGISLTDDLGTYLGVPIIHKRVNAGTHAPLIDKVMRKLAGWKGRVLSMAGRRTLIEAVSNAIPIHTMQTAILPVVVSKKLDSLSANFLWGGDIVYAHNHLVSWGKVCRSKKMGGLGLRKIRDMNYALMAKNS